MVLLSDEKIVAVTPDSGKLVVTQNQPIVAVSSAGSPGPQGPIGPAGGDVIVYDRNGIPANPWVINHGLGRPVHVTVLLDSGEQVWPGVVNDAPNYNITTINWGVPTSGKALVG